MSEGRARDMSEDATNEQSGSARRAVFWRGLEELADTPDFRSFLHREFPRGASEWVDSPSRREFLKLMAASFALAGLTACGGETPEKIVPPVYQPEQRTPGLPLYYATALPLGGYARGVVVTSREGRPIKIEGNPQHPASLGATDAFGQASILSLYDPDRAQAVTSAGTIRSWDTFLGTLTRELAARDRDGGAGLRILTETVTSPTLAAQLRALLARYPNARWHHYEPLNDDNARAGIRLAFDQEADSLYRFDKARVILALDADFLLTSPGHLAYARQFTAGRRVRAGRSEMNRLYVAEATPTITGAMADHRLPLRAGEVATLARAVARGVGVEIGADTEPALPAAQARWVAALVRDLVAHRGASLVVAGDEQPPIVHALAAASNATLGNLGQTVSYLDPVAVAPPGATGQLDSLRALTADMAAGRVDTLIILGGNPVLTAPADLGFAAALDTVRLRIGLGQYEDETAARCTWHIPETHTLEQWGDLRAHDGTATILQPLIAPLYNGKSTHELLAALLGTPGRSAHTIVREYWQGRAGGDFNRFWRTALDAGIIADTAAATRTPSLRADFAARLPAPTAASTGLELIIRRDPTIWDGRFANNAWLQELPKPLMKLTWDNAAFVSPATAARLGVATEDLVELRLGERAVRAPIWVLPGHADESVTVTLGYGRTRAGSVGTGLGFDAYALRTADSPGFGEGLAVRPLGERYTLASTQIHFSMEGRALARTGTLAQFQADPAFLKEETDRPSLYPEYRYTENAWAMSIDINSCIGCNACAVACQSENNIPVVGKAEVLNSREMNWLRIDAYYEGEADNPHTVFQPRACMHCEKAPCEVVCPVMATVHDAEGLNTMVYNRCVGTRYCSNNCPYKVRRFNFLAYNDDTTEVLKLRRNPEVTVRMRGVMEKCTYCTQRIQAVKYTSQKENRPIRDGELLTACQQACPTGAIIFGNLNDRASQVAKLKAEPLDYSMLGELNTQPRTTYLARLRNVNPELATE